MLYCYKKIEQGKDVGRWMKVTVQDDNGKCEVIDVEIADNIDTTSQEMQEIKNDE